jgi:hypothetical protein
LSEAESCFCVFVVDVSKAATLIGNVFLTYVRDLVLETINAQGDIMLQSTEEIFGIQFESKTGAGGRAEGGAAASGGRVERKAKWYTNKKYFLS